MTAAVTFDRFGGPEVLRLTETQVPDPGPGQIKVRVRAAGVNPVDGKIRRGEFAGKAPVFPRGLGIDVAGVVDSVGPDVRGVVVGAEVLGLAKGGGYAEHALLTQWATKPTGLSWEVAASIPTAGEAAFRALKQLDLEAGETVLIHGAAGSVGSLATQLAVARGVHVIGTVSAADDDYLRSLGGVPVRFGAGLVDRVRALGSGTVDAALDVAGRGALPDSIELTGGTSRVITLADPDAATYGVRFSGGAPDDRAPEALEAVVGLVARGELSVRVGATFPLDQAAQAHQALEDGTAGGKIVLLV